MSEAAGRYRVATRAGMAAALPSKIKSIKKGIAGRTFDSDSPSPEIVQFLFNKHGWSQTLVASMLRVDVSTVRRWTANPEQLQFSKLPYAQWLLLLILAGEITLTEAELPIEDSSNGRCKAG